MQQCSCLQVPSTESGRFFKGNRSYILCFLHFYLLLSEKTANCHVISDSQPEKIYNVQLAVNYYVHTYQILICPFFWYVRTLRSVHKTICIGRFCNNFYPRKSPYSSPSRIFYCIAMFQIIFCLNSNHSV